MNRKIYLGLTIIMLSFLLLLVILPYIVIYIDYMNGLKSFSKGASVEYSGKLYYDFFDGHKITTRHYRFYLKLNYYDNIEAKLELYDDDNGEYLAGATANISREHELLRFLMPSTDEFNISSLNSTVRICGRPGSIFFAEAGQPTSIGVPPLHAAFMRYNNILFLDSDWNNWGCSPIVNATPIYYTYARIGDSYMLIYHQSSNTLGKLNQTELQMLASSGPPLVKILVDTFNVQVLNETLSKIICNSDKVTLVIEDIKLKTSNVFPTEQNWIKGMFGTYMYLTPLSQILTIAVLILYVLYLKQR
jgi:hypothetical protein